MSRFLRRYPAPSRNSQDATRRITFVATLLYYVVGLSSGWTDPTAVEIKAGRLSGGGPALASGYELSPSTTTAPFTFANIVTGLAGGTAYRVAYVWSDSLENSAVAVSEPIFTVGTIGYPASDTSAGAWVPSTGATLAGVLDEDPYSDADYISTTSLSTCELLLSTTTHPGSASQTLAYRASSSTGNGLTVTLKQGLTTIATWSHALTGTDTLYTQTLTAPEIATITAGALSVTLTST